MDAQGYKTAAIKYLRIVDTQIKGSRLDEETGTYNVLVDYGIKGTKEFHIPLHELNKSEPSPAVVAAEAAEADAKKAATELNAPEPAMFPFPSEDAPFISAPDKPVKAPGVVEGKKK